MEASRITIDPDTRKAARPMTRHGRTKLRRQIVVDYIKAKPYGKRIKLAEFQRICQFKNSGNTQAFINRMIRDHVIERHNIGLKTYFYTADGKIKTKKLINPAPPPAAGLDIQAVERLAMEYSWANHESNNDLREFIKFIKKGVT